MVAWKDQKAQHHNFLEAMADKGESLFAKTHAGKHARLINFLGGFGPDIKDRLGVYFWDPLTLKHTLEIFKFNRLEAEEEEKDAAE